MFKVINGVPVWGDPDMSAVEQIKRCVAGQHAAGGALMADHRLAWLTPQHRYEANGGRASYRKRKGGSPEQVAARVRGQASGQ